MQNGRQQLHKIWIEGSLMFSRRGMMVLCLIVSQTNVALRATEQKPKIDTVIPRSSPPTLAQIDRAITLSASYLERACGPDGKFVYEVDINTGKQSSAYNIFRHAGAIYALGMLNRDRPSKKAVDAMVRAAAFMRRNYIASGPQPDQLLVWSGPEGDRSEAELGAAGLALVALSEVHRVAPTSIPIKDLQDLGRFVISLQKEDGSFFLMYRSTIGPIDHFQSTYSTGEAILGLIALYETDRAHEWLHAASKAMSYVVNSRSEILDGQLDQWSLISTDRLVHVCQQEDCSGVYRDQLIGYATNRGNWIARQQWRNPNSTLDGAFDPGGQTAVAAAVLEGLFAAVDLIRDEETRKKLEAVIERGIVFVLKGQIKKGAYLGGVRGALRTSSTNSSEIRIDFVQHTLCALVRYRNLFEQRQHRNIFARQDF